MIVFLKTMWLLLWSAFRHPFTNTVIYTDETGRVWADTGETQHEEKIMNGDFAKLFGEGPDQILVVYRNGGTCPTITMTLRLPGLGIMDSKFEYEDTDEGYATAAERFASIDEEAAQKLAASMRKQFAVDEDVEIDLDDPAVDTK